MNATAVISNAAGKMPTPRKLAGRGSIGALEQSSEQPAVGSTECTPFRTSEVLWDSSALQELSAAATQDTDEWVRVMGLAASRFDGRLDLDAVTAGVSLVHKTVADLDGLLSGAAQHNAFRPREVRHIPIGCCRARDLANRCAAIAPVLQEWISHSRGILPTPAIHTL